MTPQKKRVDEMKARATERDFPEEFSHENGTYQCICMVCRKEFIGHKRRVVCKLCSKLVFAKEPPQ